MAADESVITDMRDVDDTTRVADDDGWAAAIDELTNVSE